MKKTAKTTMNRPKKSAGKAAESLSEIREVRERFQREKPTLAQVLAVTGQKEAITLGEYMQAQELLIALRRERERQGLTLAQLAERTGFDSAVLSRLFTGRQANTTLATVGRIAFALGKELVHSLRDLTISAPLALNTKKRPTAPR